MGSMNFFRMRADANAWTYTLSVSGYLGRFLLGPEQYRVLEEVEKPSFYNHKVFLSHISFLEYAWVHLGPHVVA